MSAPHASVKSLAEFKASEPEYQTAVRKIVRSHAVNELYGAQVYDEPAIALAPNPYLKWLTCRIAMEEYGHHVRFRQLGEQIGHSRGGDDAHGPPAALDLPVPACDLGRVLRGEAAGRSGRDHPGRGFGAPAPSCRCATSPR